MRRDTKSNPSKQRKSDRALVSFENSDQLCHFRAERWSSAAAAATIEGALLAACPITKNMIAVKPFQANDFLKELLQVA